MEADTQVAEVGWVHSQAALHILAGSLAGGAALGVDLAVDNLLDIGAAEDILVAFLVVASQEGLALAVQVQAERPAEMSR